MNFVDLHYRRVMKPAVQGHQRIEEICIDGAMQRRLIFYPRPPEYTYVERDGKTQHNRKGESA